MGNKKGVTPTSGRKIHTRTLHELLCELLTDEVDFEFSQEFDQEEKETPPLIQGPPIGGTFFGGNRDGLLSGH